MSFTYRGNIYLNPASATITSVAASGNNLFIATTETKLRKYNYESLALSASATLSGSSPSDITFIAPGSGVISYNGSSRYDIFDVNTLALNGITANATTTTLSSNEQIAGIPAINLAMATSNTTGKCTLVSLTCAAQLTPTALSGTTAQCVIARQDSQTWILGTANGQLVEINSVGGTVTTVTLPSGSGVSTPTIKVKSLSFTPTTSALAVVTDGGIGFIYNWASKTLLNQFLVSDGYPMLCPSSSGVCIYAKGTSTSTNSGQPISQFYFEQGYPIFEATQWIESSSGQLTCGLDNLLNYAYVTFNTSSFIQLALYNISPTNRVLDTTRAQSSGVDIAQRIIRIRREKFGAACVEQDNTYTAGSINVSATQQKNYVELSLEGNNITGAPPYTAWDVRELQG